MQPILPSGVTSPSLTLTSTVPMLRTWQVGQILQAMALTDSADNHVTLRIGQARVEAYTQTPISAGQTLELQVVRPGEQPVLKLLPAAPPPTDPTHAALLNALPKQTGLAPLLANLGALANTATAGTGVPTLPAPLLQLVERIYRELSDSRQTSTARGLRQALRDSGLFLEAKLGQLARDGTSDLGADFKAALLRLQAALRDTPRAPGPPLAGNAQPAAPAASAAHTPSPAAAPAPSPPLRATPLQAQAAAAPSLSAAMLLASALDELQRQAEGTLARLQLHQLASLPATSEATPAWLLELPIRHQDHVDLFHLRIARDDEGSGGAAGVSRPWVITLAFDLPQLGPVHARISVQGEQVSTAFWAENPATAEAFRAHLDTLRETLHHAGLGVGSLTCHAGPPPYPPAGPQASIMDTRA